MHARAALQTQAMIVAGLTHIIDQTCQGAYAISMQNVGDANIIYDSTKPRMIPTPMDFRDEHEGASPFARLIPGSEGRLKRTTFEDQFTLVRSLSHTARRFVRRNGEKRRRMRREALSMAERADKIASFAGGVTEDKGRIKLPQVQIEAVDDILVDDYKEAAKDAVLAGMILARLGGGENLLKAQEVLMDGARYMAISRMPIAGAVVAGGAANLAAPWSVRDYWVKEMRQEAGRMWSQSIERVNDPASELDRIFYGLVNAPKHKFVRGLLIKLVGLREEEDDLMIAAGDSLRLGLAIAKSSEPSAGEWNNVMWSVNKALTYWWVEHKRGNIDIDDLYPEMVAAEETLIMAGRLASPGVFVT